MAISTLTFLRYSSNRRGLLFGVPKDAAEILDVALAGFGVLEPDSEVAFGVPTQDLGVSVDGLFFKIGVPQSASPGVESTSISSSVFGVPASPVISGSAFFGIFAANLSISVGFDLGDFVADLGAFVTDFLTVGVFVFFELLFGVPALTAVSSFPALAAASSFPAFAVSVSLTIWRQIFNYFCFVA